MTKRDLSRFERIERQRGEPTAEEPQPEPGRFDGVAPQADIPTHPAGPAPQRFEPEGVQVAQGPLAALAMIRCPRCQTDNGKFETVCLGCRERLDDEETRTFNELLLELWREAQATEREAEAQKRDEHLAQLAQVKAEHRAQYEAMARTVAAKIHERLPADSFDERVRRWVEAGREWLVKRLEKPGDKD